jgi:hypothetical protein
MTVKSEFLVVLRKLKLIVITMEKSIDIDFIYR